MTKKETDIQDRNGDMIHEGDTVRDGEFIGKVVFKNGSWRVDINMGPLEYNRSLLYGEGGEIRWTLNQG